MQPLLARQCCLSQVSGCSGFEFFHTPVLIFFLCFILQLHVLPRKCGACDSRWRTPPSTFKHISDPFSRVHIHSAVRRGAQSSLRQLQRKQGCRLRRRRRGASDRRLQQLCDVCLLLRRLQHSVGQGDLQPGRLRLRGRAAFVTGAPLLPPPPPPSPPRLALAIDAQSSSFFAPHPPPMPIVV
jgi:hypothetical protein